MGFRVSVEPDHALSELTDGREVVGGEEEERADACRIHPVTVTTSARGSQLHRRPVGADDGSMASNPPCTEEPKP